MQQVIKIYKNFKDHKLHGMSNGFILVWNKYSNDLYTIEQVFKFLLYDRIPCLILWALFVKIPKRRAMNKAHIIM